MILFHDVVEVLHRTHGQSGPLLLVLTLDSGFMRGTAVTGDRLGEPVAAHRLLPKPQRGLCVSLLREEKSDGLAVLIPRPLQRAPRAFALAIRLVHAPADPHRPLPAMTCRCQLGTVLHHPALDGRVVERDSPRFQPCFDMAIA